MADAKIITYGELISATVDVVPDNVPVALSIEGSDGREYIRVISTESGERVVLGEGTGVAGYGIPVVIGPGDAAANEFTVGNGSGQEIEFDIGGTNIIKSQHATNFQIGTHAAHTLELITASTARLHIDADGKIVTGGDTALPALCSAGGIHLLTGTQTGQTASGDADDLVIESTAAEQGISFLGASSTRQRIQFGDTANSGMGGISYNHNLNDMSFWNNGGARSFYFLEEGYLQVNTNTPTAMLAAKGNLGTTLANTGTSADHGATPKVINCTAHGLIKGAAVVLLSGNSAAEEVFTVDAVGSANQFTVDTNPTNATSSAAVRTDPTTFKLLTGDNATALEFTNRRQLVIADPLNNIFIGTSTTGDAITTGNSNLCVGKDSGTALTTGQYNTFLGYQSGKGNIVSDNCAYFGYNAGAASSAAGNTAVGSGALAATAGANNTAVGFDAHVAHTGTSNVAVGYQALSASGAGDDNVAVGYEAGDAITTGEQNISIGSGSDCEPDVDNQIAIGYGSVTDGVNKMRLGNATLATADIKVDWTVDSDERIKENIQDADAGLGFINALRPVSFTRKHPAEWPDEIREKIYTQGSLDIDEDENEIFKSTRQFDVDTQQPIKDAFDDTSRVDGLLAQEVKAAVESLGVSFSGVNEAANGKMGIQYATLVVPLIKAVQELTARIEELENDGD